METFKSSNSMLIIMVLLLVTVPWGCSEDPASVEDEELILVNQTTKPLVYSAMELVTSLNVDIDPHPFEVSPNDERLLQPGASVTLTGEDIEKNRGEYERSDGIRFHIWEVVDDSAFIKTGLTLTGEELEQQNFRVEIKKKNDSCIAPPADIPTSEAQDTLFAIVTDPPLSEEQKRLFSVMWNRLSTIELHIARLADDASSFLVKDRVIRLDTSPEQYMIAVGERVKQRGIEDISWGGPVQNDFGRATLVLTNKGVTGTLWRWNGSNSLNFKYEPLGNGLNALICVDSTIPFID